VDGAATNQILASISPPKNPLVSEIMQPSVFTGRLKFFDEQKNYGFIIMELDNSDIFAHYDDF
jgi:hypothetical protein